MPMRSVEESKPEFGIGLSKSTEGNASTSQTSEKSGTVIEAEVGLGMIATVKLTIK